MLYKARPQSNTFSKLRRAFGDPVSAIKPNPVFKAIPPDHTQPDNLNYDIANILPADQLAAINQAGKLVFHSVGDTGGISGTDIQDEIAGQMEDQIRNAASLGEAPAFFYHLGDVVYYNGESGDYKPQFYDPYQSYPAPIFAIPGNHDGDNRVLPKDPPDSEPPLTGFFLNFCAPKREPSTDSPYRHIIDQPWPYWTLNTPFITIIGLYSNVDGSLDPSGSSSHNQPQYNWFVSQLKAADPDKCLLLAVHHPPFSMDTTHGGYQDILDAIDQASAEAGRSPDAVFTGHVHNYQRYTRTVNGRQYPYVIAGAGGYANTYKSMHKLQQDPNTADGVIPQNFQTTRPDVVLANYNTSNPGFLRLTVDANNLKGEYFINQFDNSPIPADPFDTFNLYWRTGVIN
jgi:hypothetical protein